MRPQLFRFDLLSILFIISLLIFTIGSLWLIKNRFWELFILRNSELSPNRLVRVGGSSVKVIEAKTSAEITRGLSGRTTLLEGEGMLFYFDKPGYYAFWMPRMRFSIDIIWIGEDFRVVDITKDVSPSTFPKMFRPGVPAKYVLEVPAGWSSKNGIRVEDFVVIENN